MKKRLLLTLLAALLFALCNAATIYVNSTYAATFLDDTFVGLLYTIAACMTLVGIHALPRIMSPRSVQKVLIILLISLIVTLLGLGIVQSPILFSLLFVWQFACITFSYYCFDILIESASTDNTTGRIRGVFLTTMNIGYVIGPLAAGMILARFSYWGLYSAVGLILAIVLCVILATPKITTTLPRGSESLRSYITFFKNRDLRGVFAANFLLQFFYAWMVIYMPIYLHEQLNISWQTLGIIFAIMLSAFVVSQYAFGKLADLVLGEKELMIGGLLLAALATPIVIITGSAVPGIIAAALFATRLGASALEVSTESYFFKHINAGQNRTLSIFRSTSSLAYITAPLLASLILTHNKMEILFFILAGVLVIGTIAPLSVRDTR